MHALPLVQLCSHIKAPPKHMGPKAEQCSCSMGVMGCDHCCDFPSLHPAANNWVSGTLPSSLQNLKQLRQLALGANFLQGPLPPWLGGLSELRELRLGANLGTNNDSSRGFHGSLHDSLGNLTNLQVGGVGGVAVGVGQDSLAAVLNVLITWHEAYP